MTGGRQLSWLAENGGPMIFAQMGMLQAILSNTFNQQSRKL